MPTHKVPSFRAVLLQLLLRISLEGRCALCTLKICGVCRRCCAMPACMQDEFIEALGTEGRRQATAHDAGPGSKHGTCLVTTCLLAAVLHLLLQSMG
jgi:hypothetical protein